MITDFTQQIKKHYYNIKTDATPHNIALGFSIGTLIGILPTFGLGFLIGLLMIFINKSINKASLFGSMLIWNPITITPIYYLSYKIGDLTFNPEPITKFDFIILNHIYTYSLSFLFGNFAIAIIVSILSYFLVKSIVKAYRKKKEKTQLQATI